MEATTLWMLVLCTSVAGVGVLIAIIGKCACKKDAMNDGAEYVFGGCMMSIGGVALAAIYLSFNIATSTENVRLTHEVHALRNALNQAREDMTVERMSKTAK